MTIRDLFRAHTYQVQKARDAYREDPLALTKILDPGLYYRERYGAWDE